MEKVDLKLLKDDILPSQNPLQRGLKQSNGNLLPTGAISESLDLKRQMNAIFAHTTQKQVGKRSETDPIKSQISSKNLMGKGQLKETPLKTSPATAR